MAYLLLGMLAGAFVSIPVGPFGIWALGIYMKQGWRSAVSVAVGGACGDILVLILYLGLGQVLAAAFSFNLETSAQEFFQSGIIRGICLMLIAGLLIWSAEFRSSRTNFATSFIAAINPWNVPAIGFILSKLGIESASTNGIHSLIAVVIGFFFGACVAWLVGMWLFSHMKFLRDNFSVTILGITFEQTILNLVLYCAGIICFFIGVGFILQSI